MSLKIYYDYLKIEPKNSTNFHIARILFTTFEKAIFLIDLLRNEYHLYVHHNVLPRKCMY